jgi:uncharacterized membrane protein YhhN
MDATDKMLWRAGQGAAAIFLVLLVPFHPYPGSCVLKAFPMAALAMMVFRNARSRPGILLGLGLLLSDVGDVALDLDRTQNFIIGLGAFLAAHILYISAFLHSFDGSCARARWPAVTAVVLYAAVLGVLLFEIPGDKFLPVMIYLATITGMVVSTICMRPFVPLICIGAVLFMVSDTVLAINKFMHPLPHSTLFNIGIYFVAQFLMVKGFLRTQNNAEDR